MVKPVKFTRDSGCLEHVMSFWLFVKGIIMLIYIFLIFLLLGTVLYFHFICRPILVHCMTRVSFRLFHKNLGNLREFFGQMVHRPLAKNCLYAYAICSIDLHVDVFTVSPVSTMVLNTSRIK